MICLTGFLALSGCSSEDGLTGTIAVVDGDSLRFGSHSVRIAGIDAPELGQICTEISGAQFDCGRSVRRALRADVAAGDVVCFDTGERSYDRIVARCTINGTDLGAYLIARGRALAEPRYATRAYLQLHREAQRDRRGLWQYQMQAPWEYRGARRASGGATQAALAQDCPIKGNISRKGEAIYHAPHHRDYAKVRISLAKGERCFASEAQARRAGWRAARR